MLLSFVLSMPGVNSWNGQWSGSEDCYAIVISVRDKSQAQSIVDKGYYSYAFGDGWRAGVTVTQVTSNESRKIRKQSKGFCGYDWMIESIIKHGDIRPPSKN